MSNQAFDSEFLYDHLDFQYQPEYLTEYDENIYGDPYGEETDEELLKDAFDGGLAPFSFLEIIEHCIEPTVQDASLHLGKLLIWCLIFRITTQSAKLPTWLSHLISSLTGLVALSHFFYFNVIYLVILCIVSYCVLTLAHLFPGSQRGIMVTSACLTFNSVCELFVASPQDWHQIRGAQMILTMKVISLGFDLDEALENAESEEAKQENTEKPHSQRKKREARKRKSSTSVDEPTREEVTKDLPSLLQFFGYAFCPGTSVFGPWVQYTDYLNIFNEPRWNPTWLVKIVLSSVYSMMFLTISTCWNPWMIPDNVWIWFTAYKDAMSFRASHYFVSFLSEATAVAAGFGTSSGEWKVQVAVPHEIEVPRSLTEVVKAWNIPMHTWLKNYCFKKTVKHGMLFAVITTYCASTMLHGLNFQLAGVLLSLGFYTYTEHRLRRKLADIFNASIAAARRNDYQHKEGEFLVMLANFGFGLLVCFNLTYLGVMFDQDSTMTEGYSWRHTIAKWDALGFTSHLIMTVLFLLTNFL